MFTDIQEELKRLIDQIKPSLTIVNSQDVYTTLSLLYEIKRICYCTDASTEFEKLGGMALVKQLTFSRNVKIQMGAVQCLNVIIDNRENLKAKFNQADIKAYVMMLEKNITNEHFVVALLSLISSMIANIELNCSSFVELLGEKDLFYRIVNRKVENIQLKFIYALLNVRITSTELFQRLLNAKFKEYLNVFAVSDKVKEALAQLTLPQ